MAALFVSNGKLAAAIFKTQQTFEECQFVGRGRLWGDWTVALALRFRTKWFKKTRAGKLLGSCQLPRIGPPCFCLFMMRQLFHTMGLLCAGPGAPAEAKAPETETGGASENTWLGQVLTVYSWGSHPLIFDFFIGFKISHGVGNCQVLDPLCFYLLMMCQLFHTMGLLCAGPGAPAEAKAAETETGGASETLGWGKFWQCIRGDLNCWSLISSLDLRF